MTNKAKEEIGFHYLLADIWPLTLILLGLNIFHKKYLKKYSTYLSLTIYLEYKMMTLLRVDFILLLSQNICFQKKLLDIPIYFYPYDYKKSN